MTSPQRSVKEVRTRLKEYCESSHDDTQDCARFKTQSELTVNCAFSSSYTQASIASLSRCTKKARSGRLLREGTQVSCRFSQHDEPAPGVLQLGLCIHGDFGVAAIHFSLEGQPPFAAHTSMPASGVASGRPCQNEISD